MCKVPLYAESYDHTEVSPKMSKIRQDTQSECNAETNKQIEVENADMFENLNINEYKKIIPIQF